MTEIIAAVPLSGEVDNVGGNFTYIFNAKLPEQIYLLPHGIFRRVPTERSIGLVGANESKMLWRASLAQSDKTVLQRDVDSNDLEDLISSLPDCSVHVPPEDIETLVQACRAANCVIKVCYYEESLNQALAA